MPSCFLREECEVISQTANRVYYSWNYKIIFGKLRKDRGSISGRGILFNSFTIGNLKCYYDQIIDIHFFTFSCTI